MTTRSDEVLELFQGQDEALLAFQAWRQDSRREGVHRVVLGHEVRHAYAIGPDDVLAFNRRIKSDSLKRERGPWPTQDPEALHPLGRIASGDVKPREGSVTKRVADWSPPLAFNHAFHYLLEQFDGRLFTFPEFRQACKQDDTLQRLLENSADALFAELAATETDPEDRAKLEELLQKAFRWRLGCAYYSFLRELYVYGILRRYRPHLRMHPLADTLFRTDFWARGESWELLVRNDTYKSGPDGRKPPMERFGRRIFRQRARIELDPPRIFGEAYLPPEAVLRAHTRTL
ncbi:hypothetical protein ACI780_20880 [Geodermatophilus sp. SYSU D00814]